MLLFVLMIAATAVAGWAECPMMDGELTEDEMMMGCDACGPGMDMMDDYMMHEMYDSPIMEWTIAYDMARGGGFTFVLQGDTIEKRDAQGTVLKSAMLPSIEVEAEGMREAGVCPTCGGPEGRCEMPMTEEQKMHRQQMARAYGKTEVSADDQGVYVLRAGKVYSYDLDLNQTKVYAALDTGNLAWSRLCECAVAEMQDGSCPVCRLRSHIRGEALQRALNEGVVALVVRPRMLKVGEARFGVHLMNTARQFDAAAGATAFIYPMGNPGSGMRVPLTRLAHGRFYGQRDIATAGNWQLALRVTRPGMADEMVYYNLMVH